MNRREFVALAPAFPAAAVAASLTLREEGKEPIELDVSVLKVQPGDTVVISARERITREHAEHIKAHVEDILDGKAKVMVLGHGITLDGVVRTT